MRKHPLTHSERLKQRAQELIPGGSQTGSKSPTRFVQGVAPTHLERAAGCRVWDVDGNEYIDYPMALGPIVLGHDYPDVREAVKRQLTDGTTYSLPHPLQVTVAEMVTEVVPCAEMVRFGKNGNDMTTLAAKLARAHTGRDIIATQGYHGWPDVWMAHTDRSRGIPDALGDYTVSFEYNNLESLEAVFDAHPDNVAAVVTTAINLSPPEDNFLERVKELCEREGTLLVFDEILTGFRFAVGGAQEYFGVTPDLAAFAKGISNGYPLSALAGRADVMQTLEDDVFFSMTYAGEALSLAAAKACLEVIRDENVTEHIHHQGNALRDGYNDLAYDHGVEHITECTGLGPRVNASFNKVDGITGVASKSLFMQEAMKRGVLFSGSHLPSYSHSDEDIETTLDIYDEVMGIFADAHEHGDIEGQLEGKLVGATLRERLGEEE